MVTIPRVLFAVCVCAFSGVARATENQPLHPEPSLNVLLITADDMNRDSVGVYQCPVKGTTPNIDRLASQSMRFQHAHVTVAICQPCRAVWMTGRYPQNNGALGFDPIKPKIPTLPETLRKHGYMTGVLGKTRHVIPSRTDAFDYSRNRWELHNGRDKDRYAQFMKEFIAKSKSAGKPFFLMVNLHDPHRPFDKRQSAEKRKLPKGALSKKKKSSKGFDYPAPSRIFRSSEIGVPGFLVDVPEIREEMARYYSSVRRADDVVGEVLKTLKASGQEKNTIVMFLSDHGIAVPFAKTNCWLHSTATPWMIRWPGRVKPGTVDKHHMISGIDLAPTVLDALKIPPMTGVDGKSFLAALDGKKLEGFDHVYTQINSLSSKKFFRMRAIQDKQYGFIWNEWADGTRKFKNAAMNGLTWKALKAAGESNSKAAARAKHFQIRKRFEFYDYSSDPDAVKDLMGDTSKAKLISKYSKLLASEMTKHNDPLVKKLELQLRSRESK